jgi:hypothetical protein
MGNPEILDSLAEGEKIRRQKLAEMARAKYKPTTAEIAWTVPMSIKFQEIGSPGYGPAVRKRDALTESKILTDIADGQKFGELKRLNLVSTEYEEYKASKKKNKALLDTITASTSGLGTKIDTMAATVQGQLQNMALQATVGSHG